ncbi:phenylalanine--tRNA ligase subunit beta [Trichothermofontia sichuanensis B231]|uniref:phenylalanine--tRNA ligase subunit beta n=1 Tax=Trichothermofontia sichuanensis TaxID=3045816 RepID=UPI0022460E21|nr:phenylalanine--tRNA ligase subunit beta [Trichothermofontia sichuanensis]UZQ53677.1 phenylalanine--tRNA ligase subunit beta [Trichothermofontia sichuanensis B231]
MRISLNWLREFVDISLPPAELAETLTMAGFEVEAIEDRRAWAAGVVVGKVIHCERHPNADKLSVCQVDIGTETLGIVCGAPNVRADILVPVATIGSYLPQVNLKIKATKLRGVPSHGMICSLAELGLSKESAGIHIFDPAVLGETPTVGTDARPFLGLDDVVFDLTSTANRADALSMIGIAREVAALTGAPLTLPSVPAAFPTATSDRLQIKISEPDACPLYIGTLVTDVHIAPSPLWLQQRLQAAGVRPINNVVDITNYVLLEWGQPLHAFDYDRLLATVGDDATSTPLTIGVRYARPGETLTTLDGQERSLQPQTLLITAQDQPVALAGVMGGAATEVHDRTRNLLLEAAMFEPVAVRRSARTQALRTEASTRYERGVNQVELPLACRRALDLLTTIAAGQIQAQVTASSRSGPPTVAPIPLRLARVQQVLGLVEADDEMRDLQADEVERILTRLGCTLVPGETADTWHVTVPPYRYRDLEREIDLIEEIARLYGYDRFGETLPDKTEAGFLPIDAAVIRQLRSALQATGLTEVVNYSLVKAGDTHNLALTPDGHQIAIINPLLAEYSALRTELVAGLIDNFQYNLAQGNGPLNAFELGRIFWRDEDGLQEADRLAGILGGDPSQGKWQRGGREQPLTWFEAKGVLESVFQYMGLSVEYQPDQRDTRLHPGRTASLWLRGERLGTFGQLHPQFRQVRDLPDAVYVFELDLDVLLNALCADDVLSRRFRPYTTYPASARDIAFYAPLKVSVRDLERVIAQAGKPLLADIELFDEYRRKASAGPSEPTALQRSLAFRLIYRASDRTLTDAEVETIHQTVRDALVEKFGVILRS